MQDLATQEQIAASLETLCFEVSPLWSIPVEQGSCMQTLKSEKNKCLAHLHGYG